MNVKRIKLDADDTTMTGLPVELNWLKYTDAFLRNPALTFTGRTHLIRTLWNDRDDQ